MAGLYDPDPDATDDTSGSVSGSEVKQEIEWIVGLLRDPDPLLDQPRKPDQDDLQWALDILQHTLGYLRDPFELGWITQPGGGERSLEKIEKFVQGVYVLYRDPGDYPTPGSAIARVVQEYGDILGELTFGEHCPSPEVIRVRISMGSVSPIHAVLTMTAPCPLTSPQTRSVLGGARNSGSVC